MLQLTNIKKKYMTGNLVNYALDGVSLNFRDSEFVAILGPSGSGKTTLLNIIGGLDKYDEGNLVINGISTKEYNDRDWDAYRNHSIGFIFQSYNLIPHQSILSNVELALTISGINAKERQERAKKALEEVGLGDHINKKPNQLSGGQMQRVAIARSLVNEPDILLADEPTGALDTENGHQVMELLKEVARDRLVIMVTHNPELAEEYATRIVNLRDGLIQSDSQPFEIGFSKKEKNEKKKRTSMSFLTSLSLSFNNLWTKKGRTALTALAGAIGIIGIGLIFALSGGVNDYITSLQEDTMASYPITINDQDTAMNGGGPGGLLGGNDSKGTTTNKTDLNAIYIDQPALEESNKENSLLHENNLTQFKTYLDDPSSEIYNYVSENGIIYNYNVKFDVFTSDPSDKIRNTNELASSDNVEDNSSQRGPDMATFTGGVASSASNFEQLTPSSGDGKVSQVVLNSYEVLKGTWPQAYNEVVLVLDENNSLSADTLYQLGFLSQEDYQNFEKQVANGNVIKNDTFEYDEVLGHQFQLLSQSDYYIKNEEGNFKDVSDDKAYEKQLLEEATNLTIVGVIRPLENADNASIAAPIAYTFDLTKHIIEKTNSSEVINTQEEETDINVLNGLAFETTNDEEKAKQASEYASNLSVSEKAAYYGQIIASQSGENTRPDTSTALDEVALAEAFDQWLADNPDQDSLINIYNTYIAGATYEDNLDTFGKVSYDSPTSINLYSDSFEDKDLIDTAITNYNDSVEEVNQITYTDYVALLTSSLTSMVDIITYVLIAFVSLSLVVSSIMIGIITHISILERKKEIGILRAIGASKNNISQIFTAENLLVGLTSGIIGVTITALLANPISSVLENILGIESFTIGLDPTTAIILVVASMIISIISGLWPSRSAAKQDPVVALRSE